MMPPINKPIQLMWLSRATPVLAPIAAQARARSAAGIPASRAPAAPAARRPARCARTAPRNRASPCRRSERLKKLPHSPRSAIGTTGTGVCSRMCCNPGRNGLSSPVSVSLPSGKMPTISPAAQRRGRFGERALLHRRILLRRRDRNRAHRAEDEDQQRDAEDAVIHHEADRPAHARGDDDAST